MITRCMKKQVAFSFKARAIYEQLMKQPRHFTIPPRQRLRIEVADLLDIVETGGEKKKPEMKADTGADE